MQPIGKYIVVSSIDEEINTDSGIILSGEDASQFRYKKGKVIKLDLVISKKSFQFYFYKDYQLGDKFPKVKTLVLT